MQKAISGKYGYYHLLSGQDLLLKPVKQLQHFFEEHVGKEFLAVDKHPLATESMFDRIDHYHHITANRRFTMRINRLTTVIQRMLRIHRIRNTEMEGCFAKGMEWASMTHAFVQRLLEEQERILRMAHHALCFDEMYKQMIYNKYKSEFELYQEIESTDDRCTIPRYKLEVAATLHKVDWERGTPYVYRIGDYEELINSKCMFARKFNSAVDKEIIDQLYKFVSSN
jgi:hypothetical protein